MRPHPAAIVLLSALLGAPLAAQRLIASQAGTQVNGALGRVVRGAGDLDNDGTPDFLVTQPRDVNMPPNGTVFAVSGATRANLFAFTVPANGCYDASAIGDVDNDGRRDLTVSIDGGFHQVQVRSGLDGHVLRTIGTQAVPLTGPCCDLGDRNNDGRPDFAALALQNSVWRLQVVSGRDGGLLGPVSVWSSSSQPTRLFAAGDLNNDGRGDVIASAIGEPVAVVDPHTGTLVRTLDHPSRDSNWPESAAIGDCNGDGRMDVAVMAPDYNTAPGVQGALVVLSGVGGLLRTIPSPPGYRLDQALAVVGDLDRDGSADLVAYSSGGITGHLLFFSGATGSNMVTWHATASWPLAYNLALAGTGDLDGDGDGDLVVGNAALNSDTGAWYLLSGRILATMDFMPTNCAGGPFLPQLGMTRPVLGQTLTVVGRDGPPLALGTLALSLRPNGPRNLGINGCDVWFDLSNWVILFHPPQGASWQFNVPLPGAPQLAGLGVALQAFYLPSAGPLGYDLSNGIWAVFGH